MNKFLLLSAAVLLSVPLSSAFAEDKVEEAKKDENPLAIVEAATADLMKGLDENQTKQFSAINNSYGVIRSVEDVQISISRAVESCSKANPDLKGVMSQRFEAWKEAVRPAVKKARTKLDKMILLQGFAQPSEVRAYLKKFEAAIVYRNQSIKAVPVTAAEDCKKLQSSMDDTQNNLVNLITESLALNEDLKVKE